MRCECTFDDTKPWKIKCNILPEIINGQGEHVLLYRRIIITFTVTQAVTLLWNRKYCTFDYICLVLRVTAWKLVVGGMTRTIEKFEGKLCNK